MSGLRTLAQLPSARRSLALRTFVLIAGIRLALWLLPFRALRGLLDSPRWGTRSAIDDTSVSLLVWAVVASSKRIPCATCLTQSLALQFLMTRSGRPSQLHIGVSKGAESGFKAHAWVEYEGCTLLSNSTEIEPYVPMLIVERGKA
jgi:hypothetical protein